MQLNLVDAIAAADEGIARADDGADVRFIGCAEIALRFIAERNQFFTTEDVKQVCEVTPREGRAWGGVMQRALRDGIAEATDQHRRSGSRVCHARPMRVWRSLIYSG
jgi:hypothetical protein